MSQCPVCQSFDILVVLNHAPRAWCAHCGARWIQQGSHQRRIVRGLLGLRGERRAVAASGVAEPTGLALEGLGA